MSVVLCVFAIFVLRAIPGKRDAGRAEFVDPVVTPGDWVHIAYPDREHTIHKPSVTVLSLLSPTLGASPYSGVWSVEVIAGGKAHRVDASTQTKAREVVEAFTATAGAE